MVPLFGPFWSVKYLNFGQKLPIQTTHHTFIESRHSEVTKNPYYVLSPEWGQTKVISSWTPTFFVINNQNIIISLIKNNAGWFQRKSFINLCKVCSLYIINRNHSNTFLLINIQKTKTCSKKTLQQGLFVLIPGFWQIYTGFCPVLYAYFKDVQINRWLHSSMEISPCDSWSGIHRQKTHFLNTINKMTFRTNLFIYELPHLKT